MMKSVKRLIAMALVATMLVSMLCLPANAAMLTNESSHNVTNDGAVKYTQYSAAGAHTETATVLEFNPKDGYIPVAFVSNPSGVASLADQYSTAVNTYGYEVAGVINGGYFTTSTSTLEGTVITDGKLVAATKGSATVVAFGADGSMNIVATQPKYTLTINGKSIDNPIYYFNKDYHDASTDNQSAYMYYYDYSNNAKTSYDSGVEVVFEKKDNSDLAYGETLLGEVVKTGTSTGITLEKNQFVLYAKTGSAYASELSALSVGDMVALTVSETNASAVEIMNNANSVLNNIDYLVKDGENYTTGKTDIGGHDPTSTYSRWTAYGVKADGTYVFFTSDGGSTGNFFRSLTLNDVANALIELGCVEAVRLDGGGSTGMYVSNTGSGSAGLVMSPQRSVADTILVVKKSSMYDATLEAQLESAIASAKATAGTNTNILNAIAQAESLIGTNATEGQLRKAIAGLSPKAILGDALAKCEGLNIGEYSESALANIRSVYKIAKSVWSSNTATDEDYSEQTVKIYDALSNYSKVVLSKGASYVTTAPNRGDDHDDDGIRLTDGVCGGLNLAEYSYAGWNSSGLSDKTVNVDVDLGSVQSSNTFTIYMACGQWGIQTPDVTLSIYTSEDGVNYNQLVGSVNESVLVGSGTCTTYTYTVTTESLVESRYIRFSVYNTANFTWMDEIEVSRKGGSDLPAITNYIKFQSFNTKITAGSSTIFTPDMGALTQTNANHTWSCNIICELQSDGTYVVVDNLSWHGDSSKVITLADNQIMLSVHNDASVPDSAVNSATLSAATTGQVLHAYGIDIDAREIGVAAYVKFLDAGATNPDIVDPPEEEPSEPTEPENPDGETNILLGKEFSHNLSLYTSWDGVATSGKELTDGYYITNENLTDGYKDDNWAGFSGANTAALELTANLNGTYSISKMEAHVATMTAASAAGLSEPATVKAFYKNVAGDWVQFGATFNSTETNDNYGADVVNAIVFTVDVPVEATEVKFEMSVREGKALIFISELTAFGTKVTESEDDSEDSSEESSDDSSVPSSSEDSSEESSNDSSIPSSSEDSSEESSDDSSIPSSSEDSSEESSDDSSIPSSSEDSSEESSDDSSIPSSSEDSSGESSDDSSTPSSSEDSSEESSDDSSTPSSSEDSSGESSDDSSTPSSSEDSSEESSNDSSTPSSSEDGSEESSDDSSIPSSSEDSSEESSEESSDDSSEPSQDTSGDSPDPDDPSDPSDKPSPDDEPEAMKGDINGNGVIDSMDYVLLKRAYFGTYKLKDVSVGDINGNGVIDSMDYVLLKRVYFGTYKIS